MLLYIVSAVLALACCLLFLISEKLVTGVTLALVAVTAYYCVHSTLGVSQTTFRGKVLRGFCFAGIVMACVYATLLAIQKFDVLGPVEMWCRHFGVSVSDASNSVLSIASLCLSSISAASVVQSSSETAD